MRETFDELAGVVDLFGALTREELLDACAELAFKSDGASLDPAAFSSAIDGALEAYVLVETTVDGEPVLLAGPTAFPTLPAHATDLPHILDVERRSVDRDAIAGRVLERIAQEVDSELDPARAETLLDVTYDLETWATVDVTEVRAGLDVLAREP